MTTLLDVVIPGKPVGAARPRVVRLKNGHSHTFMPDNTVAWEERARQIARCSWSAEPLDEPLELVVLAVMHRPDRLRRKKDPRGRIPACCKPDGDNVLKLAQDALVKAGVLLDDTRVVDARVVKVYAALEPVEQEHVRIVVRRLGTPLLGAL